MVIDDLDVMGITFFPYKADAPLLVDPDAVLTLSIIMQGLQMIGRWNPQSLNEACSIEYLEFDHRRALY
jgi:hypothetical protein